MSRSSEQAERKSANLTEEQWKTLWNEGTHAAMLYQMYEGLSAPKRLGRC